jgi:hypothetical protein
MEQRYSYTIKTKRRRVKTGRLLFLLALCAFLAAILFSVRFITLLNAFHDTSAWASALPRHSQGERRQVLLYTVSSRQADGLITELALVAYFPEGRRVRAVHLPVDTLIAAEGHGSMRLGHVYAAGGRELLVQSVSRLFNNLPIHYYLEIDEGSLPAAVDRAGGIQITAETFLADGGQLLGFLHEEGLAVAEKPERRRLALAALAAPIVQGSLWQRLISFHSFSPLLMTNLSWRQLLSAAEALKSIPYSEAAKVLVLPGAEQLRTDGRYWLPDDKQLPYLASWLTDEESAIPRDRITVEVLNGSGARGVATRVAERLRREGFQVQRVDNADHQNYDVSQVISRTENVDAAKEVAILVPGAQLLRREAAEAAIMVTVIVGKNYPD